MMIVGYSAVPGIVKERFQWEHPIRQYLLIIIPLFSSRKLFISRVRRETEAIGNISINDFHLLNSPARLRRSLIDFLFSLRLFQLKMLLPGLFRD
jgi:hypothetical protein